MAGRTGRVARPPIGANEAGGDAQRYNLKEQHD
jgi:hypothetical protein